MELLMTSETLSLEARVMALELIVAELRSTIQRSSEDISHTLSPSVVPHVPVVVPPVSVQLINKSFHKANIMEGEGEDQIALNLQFSSNLAKDIRAVKGVIHFNDLFGETILNVSLTLESALLVGRSVSWNGGIGYNQFIQTHQRLLSIKKDDLEVTFSTSMIFFADGTRETFE